MGLVYGSSAVLEHIAAVPWLSIRRRIRRIWCIIPRVHVNPGLGSLKRNNKAKGHCVLVNMRVVGKATQSVNAVIGW